MVIFTKYSNERSPEFCIRTEILQEDGRRFVRKRAAAAAAAGHVRGMYSHYLGLRDDLEGTGLQVNECSLQPEGVCFPYLTGGTLEQRLDGLLEQRRIQELLDAVEGYFRLFDPGEGMEPFQMTPEFQQVFGPAVFDGAQQSRRISDIDMIFSNAVETAGGYELIDYEWTFDFPVPVKYIQYRCLYYYAYGNAKRSRIAGEELYRRFGISREEQEQFAAMERRFQQYILGAYTPVWKLYDDISEGVMEVLPRMEQESRARRSRTVEVYFDDGGGFGNWNWKQYRVPEPGRVSLKISVPPDTRRVRLDPCGGAALVRVEQVSCGGRSLVFSSNGEEAENGDLIFDTEDPQLFFDAEGGSLLEISFYAEPLTGIGRELILNQHGKIRWMEQTKAWRLYRKLKGKQE